MTSTSDVRCAIYTRKSTDEGLDREFNSLDAQREAAEAYIASRQEQGWRVLGERYDDGGYSGGNVDRPALQRLLSDIGQGKVDCVAVYKVDRLSRSLLDFALSEPTFSMPVGRIRYLHLDAMSFEEFLDAVGGGSLLQFIKRFTLDQSMPDALHSRLL